MAQFIQVFIMSFVVVSIYDIVKSFYADNKINIHAIVTACLGVLLALLSKLDLFALLNIDFVIPLIGEILTGLVISKGANYVYDFITKILSMLGKSKDESNKVVTLKEEVK